MHEAFAILDDHFAAELGDRPTRNFQDAHNAEMRAAGYVSIAPLS